MIDLYSRYLTGVSENEPTMAAERAEAEKPAVKEHPKPPGISFPNISLPNISNYIGAFLKGLKIQWDIGDILLIAIILLLCIEGDDIEMLLILGLILFMGL